LVSVSD